MRVIGFISSFDELADLNPRLGRKIAGYGMTAALIEYADCDQLHFFLPFPSALEYFHERYRPWLDRSPGTRVQCLLSRSMPQALNQTPYQAIHAGAVDNYFPELCHLRNAFAGEPFPLTFTPHSLNYWDSQVRHLYRVLPGALSYDALFCTSRAARDHYRMVLKAAADGLKTLGVDQAGFNGHLDVVPLGVRCEDFGRENRRAARQLWGIDDDAVVFLTVGRLTPADKYDLEPLLGVMALVNRRRPIHLMLAGAQWQGYGTYLADLAKSMGLESLIRLQTDFDEDMKAAIYGAADVFVSPADNLQETFGLNIVEAMASGLPVIASDFSGYRDLVSDGETGFLIPTTGPSDYEWLDAAWPVSMGYMAGLEMAQRTAVDFDRLLDRAILLAESPERRLTMGDAGKKRAKALFDWPVVIGRMNELWRELKQEALSRGIPHDRPNVLGFGRKGAFSHFFSRAITPDTVVAPGPFAANFIGGQWAGGSLPKLVQPSPAQGLKKVLDIIEQTGQPTLAELTAILGHEMASHHVEYLVLWGLKYGILSHAESSAG